VLSVVALVAGCAPDRELPTGPGDVSLYVSNLDGLTAGVSIHHQLEGGCATTTTASPPYGGVYVIPTTYGSCWTVADEWGLGIITDPAKTDFDERVVDLGSGEKVWRFSNAVTGSFSDQPNSPSAPAVAGEPGSDLWNYRGLNHTTPAIATRAAPTTATFHGSFRFKSVTGAAQAGLSLNISPTARQSDRRNSFIGLVDDPITGLSVTFVGTGIGGTFPAATVIATGLSYTAWHKIDIYVEFVDGLNGDGSGNDIVTVLVNDVVVHVGTTWETYYRVATPTRPEGAVDALMFRSSGTAVPGNAGNGFFFDEVVVDNAALPPPNPTFTNVTITPTNPAPVANVLGVQAGAAPGFSGGSFAANATGPVSSSNKSEIYFAAEALFGGREVTVLQVAKMSYWTKTATTHATNPADWFMAIYTKPFVGDVSTPGWYGSRFGSEPYFSANLTDPANTWNLWSTDGAQNTLRFFESTQGAPGANFGSYTDPDWASFKSANSLGTTVSRSSQKVLYFSIQTGSAWAPGFTGQLDGLRIELTDGSVATVNFEPDPLPDTEDPVVSNVAVTPNPAPYTTASYTLTADATDNVAVASASYTIDGGSPVAFTFTPGTPVALSATITGPLAVGVYDICVTAEDAAPNVSNTECTMLAVYDPTAGFVTGGGWFMSPAGAYVADGGLIGKATFGFVSKYVKGKTLPTGNTEFQFQAGALNFSSSAYEWLVVNQASMNAQFKGTGTLNGVAGYKFMVWAKDGAPDTFRIKITDDTGATVYDNYQDGEFGTPLGGGNIMLHVPKK